MKKIVNVVLAAFLAAGALCACNAKAATSSDADKKLNIVTTIYPEYDWVMNILGDKKDNAEVTLLLDKGVDLHSYQPSAEDIMKITSSDIFIYVGGESDEWVDDVLEQAGSSDIKVINLMEVMGDNAKEEELKEGMQGEEEDEEHDHDHDHDEDEHDHEHEHHHEEGEVEYDEHVWLSLKSAGSFCDAIEKAIAAKDPDNKDAYEANLKAYKDKIDELDKKYEEAVASAKNDTLIFADRFPFRYMTEDYSLDYYAAFIGCSAETEASFETISFLAEKVDELGLKNVIVIESSDKKIAETVIDTTKSKDQKILVLDSLQSADTEGTSYLEAMETNLTVLKEALG